MSSIKLYTEDAIDEMNETMTHNDLISIIRFANVAIITENKRNLQTIVIHMAINNPNSIRRWKKGMGDQTR